ncbi:hypothetical protein WCLP8_1100017 [uncultured Gammaproteobacteria bacterium]
MAPTSAHSAIFVPGATVAEVSFGDDFSADRRARLLQTTLGVMAGGVSVVDRDLRLMLWNRNFVEFLEFPPALMRPGVSLIDLFRFNATRGEYGAGDIEQQVRERERLARKFEAHTFRRVRPNGRVLEIRGNLLPDGGFVSSYLDVTAQAQAEGETRAAKERAEQAFADLTAAQDRLLKAEKMASLGGLVAGVAHEINTPVGIAITSASTLAMETEKLRRLYAEDNMSQEDFERFLGVAAEAARLLVVSTARAGELIHAFKQIAVDQTSAERRDFDLREYVDEVLLSLKPALKKTRHRVMVEGPPARLMVDSYPGALAQLLTNLVINALTHAFDPEGTGTMIVTLDQPEPDQAEIRFSDDGRGIPENHLSKIFDPFFTTRRGSGGSGLGLHIVYNIATITLSGQISVYSQTGTGTSFKIRFPCMSPKSALAPVPDSNTPE